MRGQVSKLDELRGNETQQAPITRASALITRQFDGKTKCNPDARAAFQFQNPSPSTGKRSGACPGYVVDHVVPLKSGGADGPSYMQ